MWNKTVIIWMGWKVIDVADIVDIIMTLKKYKLYKCGVVKMSKTNKQMPKWNCAYGNKNNMRNSIAENKQ